MTGPLRSALGLLTVIPVGRTPDASRAAAWFPAVGLVLGLALGVLDRGAGEIFPPPLAAAVTLVGWVLLTGSLHLDGWIDVCDAMAPGLSGRSALRALEDPRAGALGVVGGTTLLLVKYGALTSLAGAGWRPLVLTTVAARWALVLVLFRFPYARGPEGLGWDLVRSTGRGEVALATVAAATVGALVDPGLALSIAVAAAVAGLGLGSLLQRRMGGLTGDAYGAAVEAGETAALVTAVGLWTAAGLTGGTAR